MTQTTICYKVKKAIPFTNCDHFLAYMTWKTVEEAQKDAEKLNREKPATLWNGLPIDWDTVDYFYADSQEDF